MTSGVAMDPKELAMHGKRGKQRSVHNTYFTLPVIFAMLSNHYSFLYTHENHWVILVLMMLSGALIRQFFVQRHAYHLGRAKTPWPFAMAGVVVLIGVIVWMRPVASVDTSASNAAPVGYAELKPVLEQRCYSCHGNQVQMKNVRIDSPVGVKQHALGIYQQAVVLRQMPMNNATGITEDERLLIKRWFEGGAAGQ
jgi:uncharacterized membrane protein